MIVKVTLTMDDGSVHDFLSMDDAVAHASSAMAGLAQVPVEEVVPPAPAEEVVPPAGPESETNEPAPAE